MKRTKYVTAILGILMTIPIVPSRAEQQVAMAGEGPRFYAPSSPMAAPRAIDANSVPVLRRQIALEVNGATLADALGEITKQTGLAFVYTGDVVRADARVSFKAERITVAAALTEILLDAGVDVLLTSVDQAALIKRPPVLVGTISGKVTDRTTARPINGATVMLDGSARRTSTGEDGTFRIIDVTAGSHQLEVRYIGYMPSSRTITVVNDQTIAVNFALQAVPVIFERMIITGTPGATRLKEIGNSVGSIDVATKLRDAPINNLQDLFQGREPGLRSMGSDGVVGTSNAIVLRGMNSLSQSNQPLIYVDGILINASGNSLIPVSGGQTTSRLNDLPLQDIERVEIIKGASATTLYGSQASGGVMQIFTKRGTGTAATWSLRAEVGGERMPKRFPYENPDHSLFSSNDLITTGLVQKYDLSVRGTS